jgi:hypothetical protein
MGITKKMKENKCRQGYGEKGTLSHCWWESKLVQQLWEPLVSLLKKLKSQTWYFSFLILSTWEAEIRRFKIQGHPWQKFQSPHHNE